MVLTESSAIARSWLAARRWYNPTQWRCASGACDLLPTSCWYRSIVFRLSALYSLVCNAFGTQVTLIRELMRKTEDLVRKHATMEGLTVTLPATRVDEQTLEALKDDDSSDTVKVINLGKGLISGASEGTKPDLASIGDRAQAIPEAFYDRQVCTEAALSQLQELARGYLESERERERLGLDPNAFALYSALKRGGMGEAAAASLARQLDEVIGRYPEYRDNASQLRQLNAKLYRLLLPVVGKDAMVRLTDWLLGTPRA